ncbi:MAG: hypothetical protein EZS28_035757, partial [Streblomastix strix]
LRRRIRNITTSQKQQDKNSEIDQEDIEIDPYHRATRDQDMTPLTEEANRENNQDQETIRDREIIKVRQKLEWTLTEIKLDLRPGRTERSRPRSVQRKGFQLLRKKLGQLGQRTIILREIQRSVKMQKDPPDDHSDRDSTWTENEVYQNQITTPQPKQPAQQTQRKQQVHVQPKQQASVQIPRQ